MDANRSVTRLVLDGCVHVVAKPTLPVDGGMPCDGFRFAN
ncbi:hypothetical protein TELCIR_20986 [Teladorsagia circumcincta]|uniref:Uncharacterized protein n=1 Tax=Teladorsagia circumcincta TaxID=45464 RepID=A0A2G9TI26_TELCI|nr:hypothetical protein TELCIR_20986 [Teladorsagia circumcincta]